MPEQTVFKELPATWSMPTPGEVCKMTELENSTTEYLEIACKIAKQSKRKIDILSVSNTSRHCLNDYIYLQQTCVMYSSRTQLSCYQICQRNRLFLDLSLSPKNGAVLNCASVIFLDSEMCQITHLSNVIKIKNVRKIS